MVLLCSGMFSFPFNGEAADKVHLAYVSDSPASSAAYWVAKDAGIFEKHGLDVDMLFINGSSRSVQSLIAGDLQFAGAVGTSAMNGAMAGGDIALIDGLVNTLPYYLIGNPAIKSPEDLRGKSAATHIPGTSADFALRLALKRFGIPYESIKAVMVGGMPARVAAVTTGQVDFAVVTEPGKIKGEKAGLKMILDMAKLNIPFQFTCTVATRQLIRENPKVVQQMAEAVPRRFTTIKPISRRPSGSCKSIHVARAKRFWKVPTTHTRNSSWRTPIRP